MKTQQCAQCGAPLSSHQCSYCKSLIADETMNLISNMRFNGGQARSYEVPTLMTTLSSYTPLDTTDQPYNNKPRKA